MSLVDVYLNTLPKVHKLLPKEQRTVLERAVRESLISRFSSNRALEEMVKRSFKAGAFGPLPIQHEFVSYMPELYDLFILGQYAATVAIVGATAERLCNDVFLTADVQIDRKRLTEDQKEQIVRMSQSARIDLLSEWGLIENSSKSKLQTINDERNKYMHRRRPPHKYHEADAERLFKLLCEVVETEFGPSETGRYTIQGGMITFRQQRRTQK